MNVKQIDEWADRHHPKWLDLLRIILGILLIMKGSYYVAHRVEILSVLATANLQFIDFIFAQYVTIVQIGGGIFIAIGLLTRLSILFELPILIVAVFFVNLPNTFSDLNSELGYSILVLCLLIFFLFYGSGPLSLDYYLKTHKSR